MKALFLLRHGLTAANVQRLYCGNTDLPLSPEGRCDAEALCASRPLPEVGLYVSSGMLRADETLMLLTGHAPDLIVPELREMDFGLFEMHGYDALKDVPEYQQWINDEIGSVFCPNGENQVCFYVRVRTGGKLLLNRPEDSAIVICHGGVIVHLMQTWFPGENRHFYQWQPQACRGYRVSVRDRRPVAFMDI